MQQRAGAIRLGALWALACATTAVLNLDTTVVLLRRCTSGSPGAASRSVPARLIPLFTASFASSFLPVSNLTTLIAVERLDLSVSDVVTHLALPSAVACVVGWLVFRRSAPGCAGRRPDRAIDRGRWDRIVVVGRPAGRGSCSVGSSGSSRGWSIGRRRRARRGDAIPAVAEVPIVTALAVAGGRADHGTRDSVVRDRRSDDVDAPAAIAATVGVSAGRRQRRQQPSGDAHRAGGRRSRRRGGSGDGCSG